MQNGHFLGVAAIQLYAANLEKAGRWYSEFLALAPYFKMPGYIEFRIGEMETELAIVEYAELAKDSEWICPCGVVFWQVENFQNVLERLLNMGATQVQPIYDRSQGQGKQITTSVRDPFGNIIGITKNDHFAQLGNQRCNEYSLPC